jgi:hypothetical protein
MGFDWNGWNGLLALVGAAIPGVLVALVAQYLAQRREDRQERRLGANARALLALEINANLEALRDFWRAINDLDAEHAGEGAEAHLAAMAQAGLLSYALPIFDDTRWKKLPPQALATLGEREVERVYRLYGDLAALTDLYRNVVTLSPEEEKEYAGGGSGGRFWYTYFAGRHVRSFERLEAVARRVLDAGNPLSGPSPR